MGRLSSWALNAIISVLTTERRGRFESDTQREDGAEKDLRMLALKTGAMRPQTKEW